jgi:hypothetical protein
MNKYHACVWIDQVHAKVFEIDAGSSEKVEQHDHRPKHNIHRKADHVGLGSLDMDPTLLAGVAETLEGAMAILIIGPGKARIILGGYLQGNHKRIAEKIWGSEPVDHPTDAEIIAYARKFFHAADRMHA